jgi:hypothetical protein
MELFEYKSLILEYTSKIYGRHVVVDGYLRILSNEFLYLTVIYDDDNLYLKYLMYVTAYGKLKNINYKYLIYILNYYYKNYLTDVNYLVYGGNVNKYVQYNYNYFESGSLINYNNIYFNIKIYNIFYGVITIFIHFDLLGNIINIEPNCIYTKDIILELLAEPEYFPKGFYDYYSNKLKEYKVLN